MTNAHLDLDRFPDLAHGRSRWSASEAAHLTGCAECRLEWELARTARTLGDAAGSAVDLDRVSAQVARRLATEPVTPTEAPSRAARWVLAVGAAAAIAFALLMPFGRAAQDAMPGPAPVAMLHELDDLTTAELEAVLETIPPAADQAVHVEAAPFDELTAKDLERVLQSME